MNIKKNVLILMNVYTGRQFLNAVDTNLFHLGSTNQKKKFLKFIFSSLQIHMKDAESAESK